MDKGLVQIYYGEEEEDATIALGQGIRAASQGKEVIIIRFMKGNDEEQLQYIKQFEPQIKVFRFEKTDEKFEDLSEGKKQEELQNIQNGLNFARKVLQTKECSVLILDGLLEGFGHQVISMEELKNLIEGKDEETELIITGSRMHYQLFDWANHVVKLQTIKKRKEDVLMHVGEEEVNL